MTLIKVSVSALRKIEFYELKISCISESSMRMVESRPLINGSVDDKLNSSIFTFLISVVPASELVSTLKEVIRVLCLHLVVDQCLVYELYRR